MTTMSWSQSFRLVRRNVLADTKEEADAKFREYLLSEEFAEDVKNAKPSTLVPPGQIKDDDDDLDFTDKEVDEIGAGLDKQRLLAKLREEVEGLDRWSPIYAPIHSDELMEEHESGDWFNRADVEALITNLEKAGGE